MIPLHDPGFWARRLSIVVINLSLAGDKAFVTVLAVHPERA